MCNVRPIENQNTTVKIEISNAYFNAVQCAMICNMYILLENSSMTLNSRYELPWNHEKKSFSMHLKMFELFYYTHVLIA